MNHNDKPRMLSPGVPQKQTPLVGGVTAKSALKFVFKMASNLVLFVGVLFIYFQSVYT